MFAAPKTLRFDGQEFQFNTNSKVVVLEIITTFKNAGTILKWKESFGKEGFGVNKKIIDFAIKTKSKLMIRLISTENQDCFWIEYHEILNFICKNNSINVQSGVTLHTIPVSLFRQKPHKEDQH